MLPLGASGPCRGARELLAVGHNFGCSPYFGLSRFVVLDIFIALRLIYTRPLEKSFSQMLGGDKVRHMTPDFDILSISSALGTFHILVASGASGLCRGASELLAVGC